MNNIFVAGTDTGVGKSVVSLLLMYYFFENRYNPFYLKPFQTGCKDTRDTDSDARFIYSNIPQLKENDPEESVIYCFKNPKAPLFAGRDMGTQVHLDKVAKVLKEKERTFTPVIIEGAGGVLVPVAENLLVIDVIKLTGARVVLAARAGLGTINHTLLSIEALKKRGIELAGVVFVNAGESITSKDLLSENMEAIEKFSNVQVAGVINHIQDFSNPGQEHFQIFDKLFNCG